MHDDAARCPELEQPRSAYGKAVIASRFKPYSSSCPKTLWSPARMRQHTAERDGHIVGTVTLCIFRTLTGPKAYLDHLVVAPDWRQRGIGRQLVEHAIEQARAAGASRIDLTANDEKQPGRALYRSLGFQRRDTASFRLDLTEPTAAIPR
jgi:ribosomal protein S18 acetylase RimI-like enzyme